MRRVLHPDRGLIMLLVCAVVAGAITSSAVYWFVNRTQQNRTALTFECAQNAALGRQIGRTYRFLRPRTVKERREARALFAAIPRYQVVVGVLESVRQYRLGKRILDC